MLVVASIDGFIDADTRGREASANGWELPVARLAARLRAYTFPVRTATAAFNKNCKVSIFWRDHDLRGWAAACQAPFAAFR